ncbi:MAG: ornithine carbamoyltransferase [Anaerolineae bacterium]|nr:ornithine carbamoyltransferase [Anaerolineae bacterium]
MFTDFLSLADLSTADILGLLDLADELKRRHCAGEVYRLLAGRSVGLVFPSGSIRTRATFETGIFQLGAQGVHLPVDFDGKEPVADIARYLSCWLDALVVRTARHDDLLELARYADIPVINAMTRRCHPCEVLADAQTLRERKGDFAGLKLAFVGAGTNVCASWFNFAARVPLNLTLVCPPGYEIDGDVLDLARRDAKGEIVVTHDPREGLRGADVVCTDAWPRIDAETKRRVFGPYQVNRAAMALAKPGALLMPCPPVTRGEEVTAEVMESEQFAGFRAKTNLLHTHKAIMVALLAFR